MKLNGMKKKPYFLMTDGGPEHRTTFESVKVSLIHLFRQTGVNHLIAMRAAPGQSYVNPVERIMSILNIALQNCALQRSERGKPVEQLIKGCQCLDDIRKKVDKEEWMASMTEVKDIVSQRIRRCKLKDERFIVLGPASEEDINSVNETLGQLELEEDKSKLTQKWMKDKEHYKQFKATHCRERHYVFQVGE